MPKNSKGHCKMQRPFTQTNKLNKINGQPNYCLTTFWVAVCPFWK